MGRTDRRIEVLLSVAYTLGGGLHNNMVYAYSIWSTLFLHDACMLCECVYGECEHEQHVRRTLTLTVTLTHTITAYTQSVEMTCAPTHLCN